jgi:hypothetical protein
MSDAEAKQYLSQNDHNIKLIAMGKLSRSDDPRVKESLYATLDIIGLLGQTGDPKRVQEYLDKQTDFLDKQLSQEGLISGTKMTRAENAALTTLGNADEDVAAAVLLRARGGEEWIDYSRNAKNLATAAKAETLFAGASKEGQAMFGQMGNRVSEKPIEMLQRLGRGQLSGGGSTFSDIKAAVGKMFEGKGELGSMGGRARISALTAANKGKESPTDVTTAGRTDANQERMAQLDEQMKFLEKLPPAQQQTAAAASLTVAGDKLIQAAELMIGAEKMKGHETNNTASTPPDDKGVAMLQKGWFNLF